MYDAALPPSTPVSAQPTRERDGTPYKLLIYLKARENDERQVKSVRTDGKSAPRLLNLSGVGPTRGCWAAGRRAA